jgi:hypothetical protein
MKNFKFLSVLTLLLLSQYSYSQGGGCDGIIYSYDLAGNRYFRHQGTISCKKAVPEDSNLKYTADLDQCKVTIYPNPTKGLLKISLDGLKADLPSELSLYTMNGSMVKTMSPVNSYIEFDLTNHPFGVYFLRITANGKTTEWKVVRE